MDVGDSAAIAARMLGYETLKDLQRIVIVSFVNGNDVFAVPSYRLWVELMFCLSTSGF